jgi:very-short-patch-repair endonuclease
MNLTEKELSRMLKKGHVRIASETPVAARACAKFSPVTTASRITKTSSKPTPHDILWAALSAEHAGRLFLEFPACVPNRKYRIDIAAPSAMLAIEVDGWAHHGKCLSDFTRDRTRQNLLVQRGWRILRFTAGHIHNQMDYVKEIVRDAIENSNDKASAQAIHGILSFLLANNNHPDSSLANEFNCAPIVVSTMRKSIQLSR